MSFLGRPSAGLALALLLALTGIALGVARGQVPAAGTIAICSGEGLVTVAVDASGRPVGPVHVCPHCAQGILAAHGIAPPLIVRSERIVLFVPPAPPPRGSLALSHRPVPPVRAPPGIAV